MIVQETKELEKLVKKYTLDMQALGEVVVSELEKNYDKSRNADGSKMTPLKPATIAYKRKLGSANATKPLIRTGILRKSNFAITTGRNKVEISVRDFVRNGTTNNKILDFQEKFNRKPFGMSDEIDKQVDKFLDKALGR